MFLALSCLLAWSASLLALDLGDRAHKANGARWGLWWTVQGFILGYGVWAIQAVDLLIVGRSTGAAYDLNLVLASGVVAVGCTMAALRMGQTEIWPVRCGGIVLFGLGAYATSLVGMASVVSGPSGEAAPGSWGLGVSAVSCSIALWLFTLVNGQRDAWRPTASVRTRTLVALGLSVAVTVSHYSSLSTGSFTGTGDGWLGILGSGVSGLIDATTMVTVVAFATLLMLGVTVLSIVMNSDGSEVFQEHGG